MTMLVEASTSSAMRRPGYDTSSRVNRSADRPAPSRRTARRATNSSTGRCRRSASGDRCISGSTDGQRDVRAGPARRPRAARSRSTRQRHRQQDRADHRRVARRRGTAGPPTASATTRPAWRATAMPSRRGSVTGSQLRTASASPCAASHRPQRRRRAAAARRRVPATSAESSSARSIWLVRAAVGRGAERLERLPQIASAPRACAPPRSVRSADAAIWPRRGRRRQHRAAAAQPAGPHDDLPLASAASRSTCSCATGRPERRTRRRCAAPAARGAPARATSRPSTRPPRARRATRRRTPPRLRERRAPLHRAWRLRAERPATRAPAPAPRARPRTPSAIHEATRATVRAEPRGLDVAEGHGRRRRGCRRAPRHERQDPHRQRRQDVGLVAAGVGAVGRREVVGDGQRREC